MKTRHIGRLGVLAIVLCLMSTTLMAGTLAKYTSEATGTATAVTAKWSAKAGKSLGSLTLIGSSTNINLGNFVTTASAATVGTNLIAPGTMGKIPWALDMTGTEVGYTYRVTISADADNIARIPKNLQFFDTTGTAIDIAAGAANEVFILAEGTVAASATGLNDREHEGNVGWRWAYTGGDVNDTNDGISQAAISNSRSPEFTIKITATQVEPE